MPRENRWIEAVIQLHQGDCIEELRKLPADRFHCCVTSPPYWGLRDYGAAGQIGLEKTPALYVARIVEVFREVWRVLRPDGTLWLNLGDTYASNGGHADTACNDRRGAYNLSNRPEHERRDFRARPSESSFRRDKAFTGNVKHKNGAGGIKAKDLIGIPWRVAFAPQEDGWWLRQDIIWHKPNPMPESVTDRCTKAHEYVFLLSKSERYFYDADAIREPHQDPNVVNGRYVGSAVIADGYDERKWSESCDGSKGSRPPMTMRNREYNPLGRNRRSVWTVQSAPYMDAHFATFPPNLIKPCIMAGCPVGGEVLDPFGGSGTTGQVAIELGRKATLIELNPEYIELATRRCNVTPGLPLA